LVKELVVSANPNPPAALGPPKSTHAEPFQYCQAKAPEATPTPAVAKSTFRPVNRESDPT